MAPSPHMYKCCTLVALLHIYTILLPPHTRSLVAMPPHTELASGLLAQGNFKERTLENLELYVVKDPKLPVCLQK